MPVLLDCFLTAHVWLHLRVLSGCRGKSNDLERQEAEYEQKFNNPSLVILCCAY